MNPSSPTPPFYPPTPDNRRPSSGLIDAVRGPIMLIAIGLLMAADQADRFGIDRTWPALLILFGVLKVAAYAGGTRE